MKCKIERWVFTPSELKNPENCKSHDIFVAYGEGCGERGVQVERNGTVTNMLGDGTRGVDEEERDCAAACETLSAEYTDYPDELADEWKNVKADKDGNFLGFAPDAQEYEVTLTIPVPAHNCEDAAKHFWRLLNEDRDFLARDGLTFIVEKPDRKKEAVKLKHEDGFESLLAEEIDL